MYIKLIKTHYHPVLIFRNRNGGGKLTKHIVYYNHKRFRNVPTCIIMSSGKSFEIRSVVLDTIVAVAEDGKPDYFVRCTVATPTTEMLKSWIDTLECYERKVY